MTAFIFLLGFGYGQKQAFREADQYYEVYDTTATYDKCRNAYLTSENELYQPYKKVFEHLDTVFIGRMSINTFNRGVELYQQQTNSYQQTLNDLIEGLSTASINPALSIETKSVKSVYFSDEALVTYASLTKEIMLRYFSWTLLLLPLLGAFVFALPDKSLSFSDLFIRVFVGC